MKETGIRVEMRCIVYCDIASYTTRCVQARQEAREEDFNAQTAAFLRLWRETAEEHGATFVKLLGDGVMATFADPMGGLHTVMDAMRAALASPECAGIEARVGMHVGAVSVQSDGDILGADAALGERIMAEGQPGQVLLSEACASHLRPYLPAACELAILGERRVKGFDKPVRIYRLCAPGLPVVPTPPVHATDPAKDAPARVLLTGDETEPRRALAHLLSLAPRVELVGQTADGSSTVDAAIALQPDVILMDVDMLDIDGTVMERIRKACPDTEVLVLAEPGKDEKAFAALAAGAIGSLPPNAGMEELIPAIEAAYRKEPELEPGVVERIAGEFERVAGVGKAARQLFTRLNRRESEVLEMLATGCRSQEVAEKLALSEQTVKTSVNNVLAKLQINERTEAALQAGKEWTEKLRGGNKDTAQPGT